MFSVTAFQNALLSSDTMSSACCNVTLFSCTGIRRAGKSGSKITVTPASFAIVSNTIFASFVIDRLIAVLGRGLSSGGMEASGCSSLPSPFGGSVAALFARFFSSISFTVLRNSCSAMGLDGSIAAARCNSEAAASSWPRSRSLMPFFTCSALASNLAWLNLIRYSAFSGSAFSAF